MNTNENNSGTLKFSNPVSTVKEETKRGIEIGDLIYNTSGKFLAVCTGREGIYVHHRTIDGTEGCNYEHYYVRIESMLKENQELKAIKAELVHEIEQLILHAEEDSLTYSVLEHARKLVYLKSKAQ